MGRPPLKLFTLWMACVLETAIVRPPPLPSQVHHFNPGGNLPAWLVNWLAEGKPSSFVRRLEVVAQKWDAEAARVKHMPCKGRGFGEWRLVPHRSSLPSATCSCYPPPYNLGVPGIMIDLM